MTTCKIYLYPAKTEYVLVDLEDYEKLNVYKWYKRRGYAITVYHKKGCSRKDKHRNINLSMHRLILDAKEGDIVDHINCNRLDNRKKNLRFCTYSENNLNRAKSKDLSQLQNINLFKGKKILCYYSRYMLWGV